MLTPRRLMPGTADFYLLLQKYGATGYWPLNDAAPVNGTADELDDLLGVSSGSLDNGTSDVYTEQVTSIAPNSGSDSALQMDTWATPGLNLGAIDNGGVTQATYGVWLRVDRTYPVISASGGSPVYVTNGGAYGIMEIPTSTTDPTGTKVRGVADIGGNVTGLTVHDYTATTLYSVTANNGTFTFYVNGVSIGSAFDSDAAAKPANWSSVSLNSNPNSNDHCPWILQSAFWIPGGLTAGQHANLFGSVVL